MKSSAFLTTLLCLVACSDGKFAWERKDKSEEKKTEVSADSVDASAWQIGADELAVGSVDVKVAYMALKKCLVGDRNSVLMQAKELFAMRAGAEPRVRFSLRKMHGTSRQLIFFTVAATSEHQKRDEVSEAADQSLSLSNDGRVPADHGKLRIVFEDAEMNERADLQSKAVFPVLSFEGRPETTGGQVSGLRMYYPRSYSRSLAFEKIDSGGRRQDVGWTFDIEEFSRCLSGELRK